MKKRKVKITQLPKARKGGDRTFGLQTPPHDATVSPGPGSYHGGNDPEIKVNRTLKPTSKENATLEAELGETVITNLQGEGIPEFYKIAGKPHSKGGTPLNLPANSFIFSKDKSLKIKDEDLQKQFGKAFKKSGYTPADISLSFDLNKYREILVDPSSDKKQKSTAELMIKNYNLKLGALALTQESMKGFEDGIPAVALPYMEHMGIQSSDLLGTGGESQQPMPQMKMGGQSGKKRKCKVTMPQMNYGGIPKYFPGGPTMGPPTEDQWQKQMQAQNAQNNNFWSANPAMTQDQAAENMAKNFDITAESKFNSNPFLQKATWDGAFGAATQLGNLMNTDKAGMQRDLLGSTALENIAQSYEGTRGIIPFNPSGAGTETARDMNMTPVNFTGMESGMARMGGTQGKRKVKVTLPKARRGIPRFGGNPSVYNQPSAPIQSMRYDLPADAVIWPADKIDKAQVNDYVMIDGVPKKLTGKALAKYDDKYKDESLGLSSKFQDAYGLMRDKIENNTKLQKAIVAQYREDLKGLTPGKNLTREDIIAMQNMDSDQILNNFYDFQLRNYKVADKVKDLTGDDKKAWDRAAGKGQVSKVLKELGYSDEEIANTGSTAAFQNTYAALQKVANSGEFDEELKGLNVGQVGMADEAGAGTGLETISDVDGWYGNTTAGEIVLPLETENVYEDVKEFKEDLGIEAPEGYQPKIEVPDAKAWLQDQRNLLAATSDYLGAKKYDPWQAPLLYNEATPTFQDFRGTAARITSLGAGMGDSMATFAGPQSYNSRMSDISRKGTQGILQAQEAEQQANVNVDNQFSLRNAAMRNQWNLQKANLATGLYDKQIAANQAFDNEKRALKWNMVNMANNLTTNKWKTDTMNRLYPQYSINPGVGGAMYFDPSQTTELAATNAGPTSIETFQSLKGQMPDVPDKILWEMASGQKTKAIPGNTQDEKAYQPEYPNFAVGPNSNQTT
jgi:hypothetical protein